MTDRLFLNILKTALMGEKVPSDTQISCEDMNEIIRLAELHRVLPMIYDCVYSVCPYEQAQQEELRRRIRLMVLQQTVRTQAFLELYKKLHEQGLEPVVVKGIICRSLYPKADLRFSADEDLLITADESQIYHKALTEFGLRQQVKRSEDYYETSYFSDDGLHLEVHTSLFPADIGYFDEFNSIFAHATDSREYTEINSVRVRTLPATDHLIFLILHALKHFVHSGVGIRQVCDIIMLAQHSDDIDWTRVSSVMSRLNAEGFAAGMFAIGKEYLGFDYELAGYPKKLSELCVDTELLLRDILCAGVYGGSSMSRRHSAGITFDAVKGQRHSLARRLFPVGDGLDARYNYAKKNPMLLPVAWVHRIVKYMEQVGTQDNNTPSESLRTGKERIELLRKLGLLPE